MWLIYYPRGGFRVGITGITTSPMNFLTIAFFYCVAKLLKVSARELSDIREDTYHKLYHSYFFLEQS